MGPYHHCPWIYFTGNSLVIMNLILKGGEHE
jgi:hypothetical protein